MPSAAGDLGRLVVTSLHNRVMPLLRYDTRDLAVWSEERACPCGSNFPIVDKIVGRIEAEDVDIDLLAEELGRAAELLEVCRAKIRRAEVEVRNIVESLDESDESD